MSFRRCLIIAAVTIGMSVVAVALCGCATVHERVGRPASASVGPGPHGVVAVPDEAARPSSTAVKPLKPSRRFPMLASRSPWALPPVVSVRANPHSRAPMRWLRRRVLRTERLALSPKGRRAIVHGRVSRGALALLLAAPPTGRPLLILAIDGSRLTLQEPTLAATRTLLDGLSLLRGPATPRRILLRPMKADATALAAPDPRSTARGEIAVRAALKWLGMPYSWGGGDAFGPTRGSCGPAGCQGLRTVGFDCSGLTLYAWAQAGVLLPHYTGSQFRAGRQITRMHDLQPGDLLFFHHDLGHMGMYIGNGQMIHAPQTGDVVRIVNLAGSRYEASFRGAVRPDA